MHTVDHPHLRVPNCRLKISAVFDLWLVKSSDGKPWIWSTDCIFIEKMYI